MVLASTGSIHAQKYIGPKSDIDRILENIAAFSQYYMSGDYDGLANSYAADGIILPPGADIIQGRQAIKERWILPDGVRILHHEVNPTEIRVIGDYAYDVGYYSGKTLRADKTEVSWKGKYLIVWMLEEGEWKIYADAWNRIN